MYNELPVPLVFKRIPAQRAQGCDSDLDRNVARNSIAHRKVNLEAMQEGCSTSVLYVSTFRDFEKFRKHMKNVDRETEVWLCDIPSPMIYCDGGRLLGLRENE